MGLRCLTGPRRLLLGTCCLLPETRSCSNQQSCRKPRYARAPPLTLRRAW
jgi:hypothetical protein